MITFSIKDLYEIKMRCSYKYYFEITMFDIPPNQRIHYNAFTVYHKDDMIRFITKYSYPRAK